MVMDWISKIKGLFTRKQKLTKSRNVTRARFLYLYVIFGSIIGLCYFILSLFLPLPAHLALSPLYALFAYSGFKFMSKNWRVIWMFISDMDQGKLLYYLNQSTHFEEKHKRKLIRWVYLNKGYVRAETHASLMEKIFENVKMKERDLDPLHELSEEDKEKVKMKPIKCPQQLMDGWNKAMLVNALIYAHINIQVLDDDLRDIMELTDKHMMAFDIDKEVDKCRDEKYKKYIDTGKKASKRLKDKK